MKGYTDFISGFFGPSAIAGYNPVGKMKYIDLEKVKQIIETHQNAIIYVGLREDWNNTSGLIYARGKYYDGYVYGASCWATPIVDVDGTEIECWTEEETIEGSGRPSWLTNKILLDPYDFDEEDE